MKRGQRVFTEHVLQYNSIHYSFLENGSTGRSKCSKQGMSIFLKVESLYVCPSVYHVSCVLRIVKDRVCCTAARAEKSGASKRFGVVRQNRIALGSYRRGDGIDVAKLPNKRRRRMRSPNRGHANRPALVASGIFKCKSQV